MSRVCFWPNMHLALTLVIDGVGNHRGEGDSVSILSFHLALETQSHHVHVHVLNALRVARWWRTRQKHSTDAHALLQRKSIIRILWRLLTKFQIIAIQSAIFNNSLLNGSIFLFLLFCREASSSFLRTHWMPRFAKLENTNILRQEITFLLSDHVLLTMLPFKILTLTERYLCRRALWGLMWMTQMPSAQSFPTKQCGCGRYGMSFVTRDTVTITFLMLSMGPCI